MIKIVYWTQSGNTKAMAEYIAGAIREEGEEAEIYFIRDISPEFLKDEELMVLGCPAMGREILSAEMERYVEKLLPYVAGRKAALFGSYDWGNGQWMRDWEDLMQGAGCDLLCESLIVQNNPDGYGIFLCEEFGKAIAESAKK